MRSTTPADLTGHCARCLLRSEGCLCDVVPRIQHRTEVIVVRHVSERLRTSNTGRFVELALTRARLYEYGARERFDGSVLAEPGTYVLFPDGARDVDPRGVRRIVALDATWSQARKMYTRIPELASLPQLAIRASRPDALRLRRPTRPDGVSTLEAVAEALRLVEGEDVARELETLHDDLVARFAAIRGRRSRPLRAT